MSKVSNFTPQNKRLGEFVIDKELGKGSWGKVYSVKHEQSGKSYAAKFENRSTSKLKFEHVVLNKMRKQKGFPKPIAFTKTSKFEVLVMDKLGANLGQIFSHCGPFNLKTTLLIGMQMIERLESLHEAGICARDIKPENILIGRRKSIDTLYMVDFGLSSYWKDPNTGHHMDCDDMGRLIGTPRYASINSHYGLTCSRRDDIESLAYLLVWFIKGKLPWQSLKLPKGVSKLQAIGEMKGEMSSKDLCKGLPNEFVRYMEYSRNLRFHEYPDYKFLHGLLRKRFMKEKYDLSGLSFGWQEQLQMVAMMRYRRRDLTMKDLLTLTPDQITQDKQRERAQTFSKQSIMTDDSAGTGIEEEEHESASDEEEGKRIKSGSDLTSVDDALSRNVTSSIDTNKDSLLSNHSNDDDASEENVADGTTNETNNGALKETSTATLHHKQVTANFIQRKITPSKLKPLQSSVGVLKLGGCASSHFKRVKNNKSQRLNDICQRADINRTTSTFATNEECR
eukprot:TRINITY_DN187503_c1_g1_i1.p1 TRINITY_DN187503_c1_g1~~TRINITY_DN187503_c1_g1_i1.p1  ORF type:complete len:508 (-),score=143.46 TRINITY_DN187503_c1_g1_i1:632-2155(-)